MSSVGQLAVVVLGFSGQFEISCCLLRAETHADLAEGVSQTIESNHIMQFLITVAETFAGLPHITTTLSSTKGARDMLSKPPATTNSV